MHTYMCKHGQRDRWTAPAARGRPPTRMQVGVAQPALRRMPRKSHACMRPCACNAPPSCRARRPRACTPLCSCKRLGADKPPVCGSPCCLRRGGLNAQQQQVAQGRFPMQGLQYGLQQAQRQGTLPGNAGLASMAGLTAGGAGLAGMAGLGAGMGGLPGGIPGGATGSLAQGAAAGGRGGLGLQAPGSTA
eukprot:366277-Chlamydomonas_euryale.AAC.7